VEINSGRRTVTSGKFHTQLGVGWTVRGSNPGWGQNFPHLSKLALRHTEPPVRYVAVFSREVKRPGRGVDYPPPTSAGVKGRVKLYVYSPSGPSWPVLWLNLFK